MHCIAGASLSEVVHMGCFNKCLEIDHELIYCLINFAAIYFNNKSLKSPRQSCSPPWILLTPEAPLVPLQQWLCNFLSNVSWKLNSMMNNTTIKFYGKLKLAVNTLIYAVYQKTHENFFCNFWKFTSLPTLIQSAENPYYNQNTHILTHTLT